MTRIVLILLTITSLMACQKRKGDKSMSSCLEKEIIEFKSNSCQGSAKVIEYTFNNRTVYAFEPGTCGADMTTKIIDKKKCEILGYLGGIAGNTKIEDIDFQRYAIQLSVIWESSE